MENKSLKITKQNNYIPSLFAVDKFRQLGLLILNWQIKIPFLAKFPKWIGKYADKKSQNYEARMYLELLFSLLRKNM